MKIHSELTKYFNRNNKPQSDPLLKKTDQIQEKTKKTNMSCEDCNSYLWFPINKQHKNNSVNNTIIEQIFIHLLVFCNGRYLGNMSTDCCLTPTQQFSSYTIARTS
jgi:hypothetical protein